MFQRPNDPIILPQIVEADFKGFFREDLTEDQYHGDKTAVSSTGVRIAANKHLTMKHFYYRFVENNSKPATKAMNFGKAAHLMILEPEKFRARFVAKPDFGDCRFKENKQKRDAWMLDIPPDAVVLDEKERDALFRIVENLVQHETASGMIRDAVFEVSGYFRDPETGLKCRIRPDVIRTDYSALPDLKTARDISDWGFSKAIHQHGYHIQLAFYAFGIQQITGKMPNLPCFIAVENEPPYDVCVYAPTDGAIDLGLQLMRNGLNRIAESVKTNRWPGYQTETGAKTIDLPHYAYEQAGD